MGYIQFVPVIALIYSTTFLACQCLYIGREQVIGLAFAVQVSEYTRRNCYDGRRCNQKSLFHDFVFLGLLICFLDSFQNKLPGTARANIYGK